MLLFTKPTLYNYRQHAHIQAPAVFKLLRGDFEAVQMGAVLFLNCARNVLFRRNLKYFAAFDLKNPHKTKYDVLF